MTEFAIDVQEARRAATGILAAAVHALSLKIPKRWAKDYATPHDEWEADSRRRDRAAEIRSAVEFFEKPADESYFEALTAGLDFDPEEAREGVAPRLKVARERLALFDLQEREDRPAPGAAESPLASGLSPKWAIHGEKS